MMKKVLVLSAFAMLSMSAFADDNSCKQVIEANDSMHFNIKEFTINKTKCPEFTVELKNVGKFPKQAMGHNVVISLKSDMEAVIKDGMGTPNDVKEGDERVIAHTKLTGGGEEDSVTFKTASLKTGDDYEFFCSFPGHYAVMKGPVHVVE